MTTKLWQVAHLARRSVMRSLRQPAVVAFPLTFPLLLLAVNTGGLHAAVHLRGFPADRYIDFAIAVPFMQGALFVAMNAGTDLGRDIENGFLNRLALTPVTDLVLVLGQLSGAVVVGFAQSLFYLGVGLAAGADLRAGVLGGVVLILLATVMAVGFAAIGTLVALRTGSGEGAQTYFPLFFVLLFVSSMNLPRNVIEIGWFRAVATVNPVSYLLEGIRSLVIDGWNGEALGLGFGVAVALAALGLAAAAAAMRVRLTRT